MTHNERIAILWDLGWNRPELPQDRVQHRISGETVHIISGQISGLDYDAWIGERTGFVYLQVAEEKMVAADRDQDFDRFCKTVRDGWPVAKVAPKSRGFDFGEDDL